MKLLTFFIAAFATFYSPTEAFFSKCKFKCNRLKGEDDGREWARGDESDASECFECDVDDIPSYTAGFTKGLIAAAKNLEAALESVPQKIKNSSAFQQGVADNLPNKYQQALDIFERHELVIRGNLQLIANYKKELEELKKKKFDSKEKLLDAFIEVNKKYPITANATSPQEMNSSISTAAEEFKERSKAMQEAREKGLALHKLLSKYSGGMSTTSFSRRFGNAGSFLAY